MKRLDKKNKNLLVNTVMLYIMVFSAQLFNLAVMPYLSRVLEPMTYGKVGIATSYMAYVQIIIDFGFILSATRRVSENRENKDYLSKLLVSVNVLKTMLSLLVSGAFMTIVFLTDMKDDWLFYFLYLLSQVIYGFLPDFLYRGLEDMKIVTIRTVIVKAIFMVLIFIFVKNKSDYYLVPLFSMIGNFVAVIATYFDVFFKLKLRFVRVKFHDVWFDFKDSSQFFLSRVSGTIYQASNSIILSQIYGSESDTIGLYTSAEKIVALTKTASSPVADSVYPYMIKNKNFKLIKKILLVVMPLVLIAAVIVAIFPCQICSIIFGEDYYDAGYMLRLLIPYLIVIFPNYLLAFPVMVPLGLTKLCNLSNVIGLCSQALFVTILALTGNLNVYSLCIATSATEVIVFSFRCIVVFIRVKSLKKSENNNPTLTE